MGPWMRAKQAQRSVTSPSVLRSTRPAQHSRLNPYPPMYSPQPNNKVPDVFRRTYISLEAPLLLNSLKGNDRFHHSRRPHNRGPRNRY